MAQDTMQAQLRLILNHGRPGESTNCTEMKRLGQEELLSLLTIGCIARV